MKPLKRKPQNHNVQKAAFFFLVLFMSGILLLYGKASVYRTLGVFLLFLACLPLLYLAWRVMILLKWKIESRIFFGAAEEFVDKKEKEKRYGKQRDNRSEDSG